MNWAGLIALTVYLFGFVVTGRLVARDHEEDGLLGAFCCAVWWPLVVVFLGVCWLLAWLFGTDRP